MSSAQPVVQTAGILLPEPPAAEQASGSNADQPAAQGKQRLRPEGCPGEKDADASGDQSGIQPDALRPDRAAFAGPVPSASWAAHSSVTAAVTVPVTS